MRFILFLLSFTFFFPIAVSFAQFSSDITGAAVSINLEPQFPTPGESVTANFDDYAINGAGGTIFWFIDGTEGVAFRNQRSVKLIAPAAGTSITLTARVTFPNKPTLEATKIIRPVYLDIIIEPLTYTPVFYAGRALPVHGSLVNLTALMSDNTGLLSPANYSYSWVLNDTSIFSGARKGGNRAQITIPYGRNQIMTVTIQDANGKTVARRVISIPAVDVDVQFYEMSTLYGLSHRAINDSIILIGSGSTVRAVPYNLDVRAVQGSLYAQWGIDGRPVNQDTPDPFEINLQPGRGGESQVTFKLRNLSDLLQGDSGSFRVQF